MKHDRAARPLSSDALTRRPIPATGAALLAAMLLATAACSKDTTVYPSLGIRPAESIGFAEPEVKAVVAKPDPALDTDIARYEGRRVAVAAGFAKASVSAERSARAARGKPVGSEAWLTAQTDLAQLDDWRAQASLLVTDIERRATDRAAKLEPAYPALDAVRERTQADSDRIGEAIGRIQATLPAA